MKEVEEEEEEDEKYSDNLRQCVIEVFWSISTDRSRNVSSLLRTVSQQRQRVSLTRIPWNISCIHVGLCRSSSGF